MLSFYVSVVRNLFGVGSAKGKIKRGRGVYRERRS